MQCFQAFIIEYLYPKAWISEHFTKDQTPGVKKKYYSFLKCFKFFKKMNISSLES